MIFTSGLCLPVGPVLLPDSSWLVSEMAPDRGCVTHITPDGKTKRVVARVGQPNGMALGQDQVVWLANSNPPALMRLTLDGKAEVFVDECQGEPFLLINDLTFGPDGALYVTDSGIRVADFAPGLKVQEDFHTRHPDGRVYRVDLDTKSITKLDSGIRFANGIAFGPDNHLYVAETLNGKIYRYRWQDGNVIGGRQPFACVVDPDGPMAGPAGPVGPDGLKLGPDGLLYAAVLGQGHICALGPDGTVRRRIPTRGRLPTNIVFGEAGSGKVYVTEAEFGTMEVLDISGE